MIDAMLLHQGNSHVHVHQHYARDRSWMPTQREDFMYHSDVENAEKGNTKTSIVPDALTAQWKYMTLYRADHGSHTDSSPVESKSSYQ